jgi:hypothetical protein
MGDLRHRASIALVGILIATGAVCVAVNQAHAMVPPADPGSNIPLQVPVNCDNFAVDNTPGCIYSALVDINYGRSLEGVGPMILPTDYSVLPPSEQLLVVFNLERTGRGLPAFSELDAGADNDALVGALGSSDPPIQSTSTFQAGPGIAAFGIGNALVADWEWMYTDGCYPYRGSADCTSISPTDPGGWMHRNAILGNYGSEPAAGAAEATATSGSYPGLLTWTAEFGEAEGGVPNSDTVFLNSSVSYPSSAAPWIVSVNPSVAGPGSTLTIEGVYLSGAWAVDFGSSGCWSQPAAESDESLRVVVPGCARSSVQVVVPPDTSNALAFNPDGPVVSAAASTTRPHFVGMATTPTGSGYWEVSSDGGVFSYGGANFYGSMGGRHLNAPIVGMAAAPDGHGYWLVGSDGGVFAFGSAGFHGSAGNLRLNKPIVGMAATADGGGYWLVASDGGVFSYGDARFHGSMGGRALHQRVVGMAADQATGGYWLVAADGGIFSFDAPFDGSTGNVRLDRPVVAMEAAANGSGYRLVASDGGIFCFHLPFEGSDGAVRLDAPVVGMTAQGTTGYWMVAADGGIFTFGGTGFYGSQG